MQWTRLMFLWLSGETFDLLPAGVNCLGVWSLFKSQVFSPQFFINVFYQVLQLKCHCFYDESAYQGKCFQIGLLKFVNFWNILNKGHGQFIEIKKEIFFQTFEKYRYFIIVIRSFNIFLFKIKEKLFCWCMYLWHMQSNMTWYCIKRMYK